MRRPLDLAAVRDLGSGPAAARCDVVPSRGAGGTGTCSEGRR